MNETIECVITKEEYETFITVTAYSSLGLMIFCVGCVIRCCCKHF